MAAETFGGKIYSGRTFFLIHCVLIAVQPLCKGLFEMRNQPLVICMLSVQLAAQVLAGTQFSSHVRVNTPARSFTHGVGDPLPLLGRRQRPVAIRSYRRPLTSHRGYPRVKPRIPFINEDVARDSQPVSPWRNNKHYEEVTIPLLPASPYKVDSPDPESLWPEGLFLPPIAPPRFAATARSDNSNTLEADSEDPYLLEGSEAVAAVARSSTHGPWYFHEIPHIESLLRNEQERIRNHLEPHVLGSIRYTWPFYRA